jgi:hypothetical protein
MGMQIIGRNHADLGVLQLAYSYEQATQWVSKHPPPYSLKRKARRHGTNRLVEPYWRIRLEKEFTREPRPKLIRCWP